MATAKGALAGVDSMEGPGPDPAAAPAKEASRERKLLKVPTPLRRCGSLGVPRPAPPSPAPQLPNEPAVVTTQMPQEKMLKKGDHVTVCRAFESLSLIKVKIRKGWKGHVVRMDSMGDALVSFTDQVKLVWVSSRHFVHLNREVPPVKEAWPPPAPEFEEVTVGSPDVAAEEETAPPIPRMKSRSQRGFPVWLHVYDLGQVSRFVLNSWAAQGGGPGGAFHCGLEVLGVEFSFQAISFGQEDKDISGVTWHSPKSHPRHVYRESVWLGFTPLTTFDISKVVEHLERTWLAKDYHCLRRNCTDFAEQMALELCAPRPFPRWAHGVAKSSLLAGGCCTPLVAKTPGARFLAPCCSSWGSTGTLLGTPRSSYITADVHYSVQEDGPWDI